MNAGVGDGGPGQPGPVDDGWPRITVVTPSYNQGAFIEETLVSVLDQDYPNLEYIVRDGGSSDDSPRIIARYADRLANWVSAPDNGQSSAINAGFAAGSGDIYAWLNSDDVYRPGALHAVARCFRQHPEARVVVGNCLWVDESRNYLRTKQARNLALRHLLAGGGGPGQPAVFFHAEVLRRVGLLDEDLHLAMDWDYWLRICTCFEPAQIVVLDRDLAEARVWPGAKSPNAGLDRVLERRTALDRLFDDPRNRRRIGRFRRTSYSDLHWRRARCLFARRRPLAGSGALLQATLLNPDPGVFLRRLKKLRPGAGLARGFAHLQRGRLPDG